MNTLFKVETTLSHDLAELYSILVDAFETNSSIPLSDLNRTLLQTGMIHHLVMMQGLGLLREDAQREARIEELIERVSRDTILADVLAMVRSYWRECGSNGEGGSIDLKA